MRLLSTAILTFFWVLDSYSQEFGTHWISFPCPNDSAEVLYRKVYQLTEAPQLAEITMASSGNIRLYVNERNITRSTFYEGTKGDTILSRTFDVSELLKKGENTIAVWFAPRKGQDTGKQLSLELYGWDKDTIPFYHKADGTWWCKPLQGCSLHEKEYFDNRKYSNDWKSAEHSVQGWTHPTGAPLRETPEPTPFIHHQPIRTENQLQMVLHPALCLEDTLGYYHVDFGRPFRGTIRLTIRNARRGSVVDINGNQYTCSGEIDEQAFYRLHNEWQRTFVIKWGKGLNESCITNIEGLELHP